MQINRLRNYLYFFYSFTCRRDGSNKFSFSHHRLESHSLFILYSVLPTSLLTWQATFLSIVSTLFFLFSSTDEHVFHERVAVFTKGSVQSNFLNITWFYWLMKLRVAFLLIWLKFLLLGMGEKMFFSRDIKRVIAPTDSRKKKRDDKIANHNFFCFIVCGEIWNHVFDLMVFLHKTSKWRKRGLSGSISNKYVYSPLDSAKPILKWQWIL